ncbi:MAG TPA: hypothetical protein VHG28_12700 [Longimicrobiaceae bacterium]|nr:hypothetical protein [Longimicrobiaceae bacterium]
MRIRTRRALLLLLVAGAAACRGVSSARSGVRAPGEMTERQPIAFPRQTPDREATYEALVEGRLVLEDGCLRVDTPGEESYLVLWPPRAELQEGARRVVDRETGATAEVGEPIRLSGGEVTLRPLVLERLESPPPVRCRGPYWLAGQILASAP